jgi:hypothetical protein
MQKAVATAPRRYIQESQDFRGEMTLSAHGACAALARIQ